jgi:hypothetical protein
MLTFLPARWTLQEACSKTHRSSLPAAERTFNSLTSHARLSRTVRDLFRLSSSFELCNEKPPFILRRLRKLPLESSGSHSWEAFITVMNALQHNDLAKDVFLANDNMEQEEFCCPRASTARHYRREEHLPRIANALRLVRFQALPS